ncbi:hypothetical protein PUN28_015694 [Cardiocondyla obscurior]|uniref:Uncharacterized protein n=1 Tax=Cardiocondyla obscurior TaxID=286306 RepID=A0AAW2EXH4_9HYME
MCGKCKVYIWGEKKIFNYTCRDNNIIKLFHLPLKNVLELEKTKRCIKPLPYVAIKIFQCHKERK